MNRSIHLLLQTKSIFTIFISEIGINRDLAINLFERFGKLLTHELFIVLDYIVVLWVPWSFYPIYIYSQTASGFCSKTRITSKYFSTSAVTLLFHGGRHRRLFCPLPVLFTNLPASPSLVDTIPRASFIYRAIYWALFLSLSLSCRLEGGGCSTLIEDVVVFTGI